MKKTIALFILMSFMLPLRVNAAIVVELDQIESEFLSGKDLKKPDNAGQRLNDDFARDMNKPDQAKSRESNSGSSWWKWALGIVVVGGIAAAAGGGGGSNSGEGSSGTTTVNTSW